MEKGMRRLPLPIGVSEFPEVAETRYYVDKTLLVKDVIDDGAKALLICRPRRFGKSLNMSMLRSFFEVPDSGDDTARLFRGKQIWQCGEEYTGHQGAHPVISLSLKAARCDSWGETREVLRRLIRSEALRVRRLVDESACDDEELDALRRLWSNEAADPDLRLSLRTLSSALHKSVGRQTVILIDEYDVPISRGHHKGFYTKAVDFMRVFLGEGMKDNPHLYKGVMTGVLRVAKEGMFSGFNNPQVYTVLDRRYAERFGLTPGEVQELLAAYGGEDRYDEAREWYDGYQFGGVEVYNPWSMLKYVDSGFEPDPYWVATSENAALAEIVAKAAPETLGQVKRLVEGGSVLSPVEVGTVYPRIGDDPSSIWSYLLMAGYLKASGRTRVGGIARWHLEIPNREVRTVYAKEVLSVFSGAVPPLATNPVAEALIDGDAQALREAFARLLACASVRDLWGEAFYQGFTLALVALLDGFGYHVESNREAGEGYFDVCLDPRGSGYPGIVVEIKALRDVTASSEALNALAEEALAQIGKKDYSSELRRAGVDPILAFGVAFRGRDVAVAQD